MIRALLPLKSRTGSADIRRVKLASAKGKSSASNALALPGQRFVGVPSMFDSLRVKVPLTT